MHPSRFTLSGSLLVIAALGVALAALRGATEFWFGVVAALSALGLVPALIKSSSGPNRTFWAGCAVAGGLYVSLAFAPWLRAHLGPQLPTDRLLEQAHSALGLQPRARLEYYDQAGQVVAGTLFVAADGSAERAATQQMIGSAGSYLQFGSGSSWVFGNSSLQAGRPGWVTSALIRDDREDFKHIGHLLIAWALALIVGVAGLTIRSLIRRSKVTPLDLSHGLPRQGRAFRGPPPSGPPG